MRGSNRWGMLSKPFKKLSAQLFAIRESAFVFMRGGPCALRTKPRYNSFPPGEAMFAKNGSVVCLFEILSIAVGHAFTVSPNLGLEVGHSQSLSYEARSLFVNPAGLAFQQELNGGDLL